MHCIVDCRVDNDLSNNYLELSLWGKTCYSYVLEAVNDADRKPTSKAWRRI